MLTRKLIKKKFISSPMDFITCLGGTGGEQDCHQNNVPSLLLDVDHFEKVTKLQPLVTVNYLKLLPLVYVFDSCFSMFSIIRRISGCWTCGKFSFVCLLAVCHLFMTVAVFSFMSVTV